MVLSFLKNKRLLSFLSKPKAPVKDWALICCQPSGEYWASYCPLAWLLHPNKWLLGGEESSTRQGVLLALERSQETHIGTGRHIQSWSASVWKAFWKSDVRSLGFLSPKCLLYRRCSVVLTWSPRASRGGITPTQRRTAPAFLSA